MNSEEKTGLTRRGFLGGVALSAGAVALLKTCLLYTSPSPRDS